jgi:hypothetical protein
MLLAVPTHPRFRPVALTVAALAVAGGSALTAHAVFTGTPTRGHTQATVTPGITAPGYVPSIDGLNPVEREAALKLQRLRAAEAEEFNRCHSVRIPSRPC